MTPHRNEPANSNGGDEPLRALRLLARKTSTSGVTVTASGGLMILMTNSDDRDRLCVSVSGLVWAAWLDKAWVARVDGPEPSDGATVEDGTALFRLTARGRDHVRRELSAGSPPHAAGTAHARAEPARRQLKPEINVSESPVGWLASRRDKNGVAIISAEQLAAAERLRADFWFAGMSPRVTTNWAAAAMGGAGSCRNTAADMSDNMVAAATRVRHAVAAVGPELAAILIDVCCHLHGLEAMERKAGWPLRSAKVVLQLALTRLARHYGLLPHDQTSACTSQRVRHWGAADYRPALGGE